ncbi:MAG: sulfotransferase family protein [Gammaproteobacteria bacterium]
MSEQYLGENLIFIISQPRSGSTLLQRVLAGHPDIQTSAEPWIMLHPVYGMRKEGIQSEFGAVWTREAVTEFLENYTDGLEVYDDAIRAWAKVIYDNALKKTGGKIFIDKTPRYALIIPELYRLFPRAKFVFLLRNPMAILASELSSHIQGNWKMLAVFRSDLLDAPKQIIEGIELLGDDAIVLRYEEFVQKPDEQTRLLCDKLGIVFQSGMVDYGTTPEIEGFMQDRVGVQNHTRPTGDSVSKWQRMLTDPQELHFAQSYLLYLGQELTEALGYPFEDMLDTLRGAAGRGRGHTAIYPWKLAIKMPHRWSTRETLQACYYRTKQDKGIVAAFFTTITTALKMFGTAVAGLFGKGSDK